MLTELILTAYCSCSLCCGVNAKHGLTRSGVRPLQGITIACDPKTYPLGTHLHIDGIGTRVCEDTGGSIKGRRVDVYFSSHDDAVKFGRQRAFAREVSSSGRRASRSGVAVKSLNGGTLAWRGPAVAGSSARPLGEYRPGLDRDGGIPELRFGRYRVGDEPGPTGADTHRTMALVAKAVVAVLMSLAGVAVIREAEEGL